MTGPVGFYRLSLQRVGKALSGLLKSHMILNLNITREQQPEKDLEPFSFP